MPTHSQDEQLVALPQTPPGRPVSPDPSFLARRPRHANTTPARQKRTDDTAVFAPAEWEVWRAEVLQAGRGAGPSPHRDCVTAQALWLCLGLVPLLLAGCGRATVVLVESTPPQATVWVDSELRGSAPQQVTVPARGEVHLRVSQPGYQDWETVLTARIAPRLGRLHVALKQEPACAVECRSQPPGAEVYVDGELRGRTPLRLTDLSPGTVALVFRMKGRQQVEKRLTLGASAGDTRVDVSLPSLAEAYYLQCLLDDPHKMPAFADLGHHYVLEKRFDDAMAVFARGIRVVLTVPGIDASRLWSEVQRVATVQYQYGNEAEVKVAREALRGMIEGLLREYPKGSGALYAEYAEALDVLGERQKAEEAFTLGWRKFPGDRELAAVASQRSFPAR